MPPNGDEVYNLLDEWKYRAVTAEQRVRDLTEQLAKAEAMAEHFEALAVEAVGTLRRHENLSGRAIAQLDDVVARLTAEEYGVPVREREAHPSNVRRLDDDSA